MPKPLYQSLAETLSQAIWRGDFGTAAKLPGELALAEHYRLSRHTVRAALGQLESDGLIERRKRAGTRVLNQDAGPKFRGNIDSVDDLVLLATTHRRSVLAAGMAHVTDATSKALHLPHRSRWLLLKTVRFDERRPQEPFCISDVYVDPQHETLLTDIAQNPDALISALIEKKYGRRIAQVEQTVTAISLTAHQAQQLNAPVGSAALHISRHYLDRTGVPFEIAVSVHPSERMSLTMRLVRE